MESSHGLGHRPLRRTGPDQRRYVGQWPGSHPADSEQEFQCARPGARRRLHDRHGRYSYPAIKTIYDEKKLRPLRVQLFVLRHDGSVLFALVGEIALLHVADILLHSSGHLGPRAVLWMSRLSGVAVMPHRRSAPRRKRHPCGKWPRRSGSNEPCPAPP